MFETNIGPGSQSPGYLRPETAQGMFVEFPRLSEYARGQLPFGVAQIGSAYRNEISPRRSLVRVREFTQAELELFIDPERDEPPLDRVADVELTLYPIEEQQDEGTATLTKTVESAVEEEVIGDPWIAYYLGIATQWYASIGLDMDRFRYRQHLPGERAHYASDCWDAEAEVDGNWIEISGFSYRSDYDLSKHAKYGDEDFTVFRQYDEEITVERATVDPNMSYLGPVYGSKASDIAEELEYMAKRDREVFEDAEEVTVELDDETFTIPIDEVGYAVEEVTEAGEHVRPHVVEPSFGVDRILYSVLDHNLKTDVVDGDERTYLDIPPEVAPQTVGVFPLMDKDGLDDRAREVAQTLREHGLAVTYDESGAIGRRYRRQDEVGTPFCVTVDYESLEEETATIRERDTTDQARVPIEDLPEIVTDLRDGERTFDDIADGP
jgi:glycyl-tRNA synthetase